ncbi:MAG: hypothetical protein IT196_27260 [Acidimicrobiales bacterium]|nr:hypothetical protein [Acidimicrobiales bacterium]
MKLILDAGALIGIDRNDRRVATLIELGRRAGAELVTTAPVIAQAWRNGARQAQLARALPMVDTRAVGVDDAKAAGELLAASNTSDVVDALLAQLALPGDQILTSDQHDLATLLAASGINASIVTV